MVPISDAYQRLEYHFAEWALTQPAIQAVIVVGSRARSDHPADEWPDLDLVVLTSAAASYWHDSTWLNTFGAVQVAAFNSFGANDREWIVLYGDGCKIDVACLSIDLAATPTLQALLDAFPYPVVLQHGVRVLVDKTGTSTELHLPKVDAPQPPTQAEFTALINRMLLDAVKTAKFIRRHDLWRAKRVCDGDLKQHLLTMLEWHAAAQSDQRDIWYDGRFLNDWADPQALTELPATFAVYEAADLRRALFATLDHFRRLAHDVAYQLGYSDPAQTDRFVREYLDSM
jgi:aminoglycoside 6-adenylyltransferase